VQGGSCTACSVFRRSKATRARWMARSCCPTRRDATRALRWGNGTLKLRSRTSRLPFHAHRRRSNALPALRDPCDDAPATGSDETTRPLRHVMTILVTAGFRSCGWTRASRRRDVRLRPAQSRSGNADRPIALARFELPDDARSRVANGDRSALPHLRGPTSGWLRGFVQPRFGEPTGASAASARVALHQTATTFRRLGIRPRAG
jgi:hypothetical protein